MGNTTSKNFPLLQSKIGYTFKDINLLKEATTHDSLRWDNPNLRHYERLEYLGDTVIRMVITEYLYMSNPDDAEGALTQKRDILVSRYMQLDIASKLQLSEFISIAPGVEMYKFTKYDQFLEAVIGAVYMDAGGGDRKGYDAAKRVVFKLWKLEDPNSSLFSFTLKTILWTVVLYYVLGIGLRLIDKHVVIVKKPQNPGCLQVLGSFIIEKSYDILDAGLKWFEEPVVIPKKPETPGLLQFFRSFSK